MNYKRKNKLREKWINERENKRKVREKTETKKKGKTKVESRGKDDE